MDEYEDSLDVDVTVLTENEQPGHNLDRSDILPNFQILHEHGAKQNCTDRTIEGFVALKITYDHVFSKQQEKVRLLQQKNQHLAAEIHLLKKDRKSSRCRSVVEQSASTLEHFDQLLSEQKPSLDLEDCNCIPNEASVKKVPSSISTLQKMVSHYQVVNHRCESGVNQTYRLERDYSQDEDMYGPEGTLGEDFSPYNIKRLCMKLMKLLQIPAKYHSMMEHISTNIGSSLFDDTSTQFILPNDGRLGCFVGIHNIKLPPTDLSKQAIYGRDISHINQSLLKQETTL